jgi:hypothetical protein
VDEMTETVAERPRRRGRPRTDTEPTGEFRRCYLCKRTLDLAEFSPSNRSIGPCRDYAEALTRDWVRRNPERHRRNMRRWKQAHRPPPSPPLVCQPGHVIQVTPAAGKQFCVTCRQQRQRQQERDLWQRIKTDSVRLAAKRARDRA